MIYLSPKGNLFSYKDGYAKTLDGKEYEFTKSQVEQCTFISPLDEDFLFFFGKIDIQLFLQDKEKGLPDICYLEYKLKGKEGLLDNV